MCKSAARACRLSGVAALHFHGYLGQSFLSPHSNRREDQYGGVFENRSRFLIETLRAVREEWPEERPLTARLGVIEFDGRDEETLAESIELVRRFKAEGLDMIDVSVGFSTPTAQIPWGPAFMAPASSWRTARWSAGSVLKCDGVGRAAKAYYLRADARPARPAGRLGPARQSGERGCGAGCVQPDDGVDVLGFDVRRRCAGDGGDAPGRRRKGRQSLPTLQGRSREALRPALRCGLRRIRRPRGAGCERPLRHGGG